MKNTASKAVFTAMVCSQVRFCVHVRNATLLACKPDYQACNHHNDTDRSVIIRLVVDRGSVSVAAGLSCAVSADVISRKTRAVVAAIEVAAITVEMTSVRLTFVDVIGAVKTL